MGQGRGQHCKCTDNVCLDERRRPVDRAIDMAFCCQMHHSTDLFIAQDSEDSRLVADIGPYEAVVGMIFNLAQRRQVPGICQLVDIDDAVLRIGNELTTYSRTNEARTARNKDVHGKNAPSRKYFDTIEVWCIAIFVGQLHRRWFKGPLYPNGRVVETQRSIVLTRIEIGDLVRYLRIILERNEAMRVALGDQDLVPFLRGDLQRHPLAKRRRALTDIDDDVEYRAPDDAHDLVLRARGQLEMQAAQHAP
jgi:hypothetical protein